jgi:hypothetical protein
MPNKYTKLGTYRKPSVNPQTGQRDGRAFLKVYMGKDGQPVSVKNGDVLSFTRAEDKLAELEKNKEKLQPDTYEYLVGMFSDEEVIAEVTLVQK